MKRIISGLIAVFVLGSFAYSQSLTLSIDNVDMSNDTLYLIGTTQDALLEARATVNNTTDKEIEVLAKKAEVSVIAETHNTFCWGVCFPPFIFEATQAITIPADGSDPDSFIGDYSPESQEGTSVLRYTFFSAANPDDSVSLIVYYQIGAAGVRDWTIDNTFLKAYPNPTSGFLNVEFPGTPTQSVTLKIISITGQIVKHVQMDFGQTAARFDLREYPDGIMFLELSNQNGKSALKKIILSR